MWENDLAREFKKRDNKSVIGACIGAIVNVNPLKVTIYDGQIMIDQHNGYICNSLLERKSRFTSLGSHDSYSANGSIEVTGEITLNEVLKAGDMVLVIPSGDEQKFFIVDILKGVS